jgi:hypothetical protein
VGEAQRRQARGGVRLIAQPVAVLLGRGAVVAKAVGLDHEPEIRPVEVHLEAVELLLGERRREPGAGRQRQETALQLGVGEAEGALAKQISQPPHAALSRVIRQGRVERLRIDQIQPVRLIDHPLEAAPVEAGRHVDHGADRRRHRDSVVRGDVGLPKGRSAMNPHPGSGWVGGARDRDLNLPLPPSHDPPQLRRALVAEDGALSTGENSGHPPTVHRQVRPPDGVDTAGDRVQTAASQTVRDCSSGKASVKQLLTRHHPMLPPGKLPDPLAA